MLYNGMLYNGMLYNGILYNGMHWTFSPLSISQLMSRRIRSEFGRYLVE